MNGLKWLLPISLIAFFHVYAGAAASERGINCTTDKFQCLRACSSGDLEGNRKEGCFHSCQNQELTCKSLFQSELKRDQRKKRCLALPNEERYFTDVVELAWTQTSAVLRVHSLLLNYVERRLHVVSSEVPSETDRRAISALISTLNLKNHEFIRYFDVAQSSDPEAPAEEMYHEFSNGASAFDVLSRAASTLVVKALISNPDERSSMLNDTRTLIASAQDLGKLDASESGSSPAKRDLITSIERLDHRVREIQSKIVQVKPGVETSERKELLEAVHRAQLLCS